MSQDPIRVCFVCLGNICRSPTAEGVMQKLVRDATLTDRVVIESAGTAAYHVGERSDKRSRQAARRRGISLESRARQFSASDFALHHYVLAMDRENLTVLAALRSGAGASLHSDGQLALLRDFDPLAPAGSEVPDPYYGGDRGFEDVLDLCQAACQGLLEEIRRQWKIA